MDKKQNIEVIISALKRFARLYSIESLFIKIDIPIVGLSGTLKQRSRKLVPHVR